MPFLWAESYSYRRLLDAVGFFEPGPWFWIDPFDFLKTAELRDPALESELSALDEVLRLPARDRAEAPAAYGVRMVAAGLGDGGKDQLPKLAKLAAELGFHVRVVLDHDKPGTDAALIGELTAIAEQVIRLPERTSVERALVHDVPAANLRTALQRINSEYGLGTNVNGVNDGDLEATIIKMLKQKGGLHQPFVDALPPKSTAPLAKAVLDTLAKPPAATILVEVPEP